MRVRNIYQSEGIIAGPAPSSGYTWVDQNGIFGATGDINLLRFIPRVQNISYSVDNSKVEIKELGKRANLWKSNLEHPNISLNFEYLQNGVYTENVLGLEFNFTSIYGSTSGVAHYPDTYSTNILDGFTSRSLTPEANEISYPFRQREPRNFYIPIAPEGQDLNVSYYDNVHPNAYNLNVYGFGDCFMNSYRAVASVNNFPKVSVSYSCNNLAFYSSGKATPIPSIQNKLRHPVSGQYFTIPSTFLGDNLLSVLRPGDISLDISTTPKLSSVYAALGTGNTSSDYSSITNLGVNFTDIKIQSYDLSFDLKRQPLLNLGWKLPIDRLVTYPIPVNFNMECIVGDSITGSIDKYLVQNDDYNLSTKLKNPSNRGGNTVIQYDLRRAKLNSISYGNQIGGQKTANFAFTTEIDPEDFTKGLFASGVLSIEAINKLNGFLTKEDGGYLLTENGDKIIYQDFAFYF